MTPVPTIIPSPLLKKFFEPKKPHLVEVSSPSVLQEPSHKIPIIVKGVITGWTTL